MKASCMHPVQWCWLEVFPLFCEVQLMRLSWLKPETVRAVMMGAGSSSCFLCSAEALERAGEERQWRREWERRPSTRCCPHVGYSTLFYAVVPAVGGPTHDHTQQDSADLFHIF